MDSSSVVDNENILERALRTYEESERSLKSICNSVEQENVQLEEQFQNLEHHHKKLFEQFHFLQENLQEIRQEYQILNEKQFLFDQQTNAGGILFLLIIFDLRDDRYTVYFPSSNQNAFNRLDVIDEETSDVESTHDELLEDTNNQRNLWKKLL